MKQKIAFDIAVFNDIINKSKEDLYLAEMDFFEIVSTIRKHHHTLRNSLWKNELELLFLNEIEQNLKDKFMQCLFRADFMNYTDVNYGEEDKEEYLYKLAFSQIDKILITDKADYHSSDLNIYSKNEFVNGSQPNNSLLYRVPKTNYFRAKSILSNFNLLRFYLSDCTLLEIIDPYLLKNSCIPAFDFISAILHLINKDLKIRCYYFFDKYAENQYNILIDKLTNDNENIEFLKPKHYYDENNHTRYLIINKDLFTIEFNASFNNFNKVNNGFQASKGFSINIVKGRHYEDRN